jgi:site-specific DNA-methyltransferase (adenine-specific)
MKKVKLMLGDNIQSLKKLPDNSIDSVVTDGPYGLSFMNRKWDYDVPSVDFWKEVYRVLKPGGHVLSFGGTRTYHRMTVNIEDAGFEIRDQIMWLYGSGFPKSHNIGKSVDKLQGNDREVVGEVKQPRMNGDYGKGNHNEREVKELELTKGQSQWEGWGTALKPANEPICVARKPLSEKSVAENVLKWGTGGINIDGCRVGTEDKLQKLVHQEGCNRVLYNSEERENGKKIEFVDAGEGRFPANIILECICDEVIKGEKGEVIEHNGTGGIWNEGTKEPVGRTYNDKGDIHTNPMCPCRLMDEQSGVSKSSKGLMKSAQSGNSDGRYNWNNGDKNDFESVRGHNDKGGSSRFFYQAKVSKAERNMGLDGFEEQDITDGSTRTNEETARAFGANRKNKTNNHPTVKPVSLMAYLCRLVTPQGGIVLDPFMGSGSTGIAAQLEGFKFCGMEMDPDYFKIASARIENFEKYRKFIK